MIYNWYSLGSYDKIKCSNCNNEHQNIQASDHHPMICPKCNIECIWYDLGKNKVIQIIPRFAPEGFRKFIKWSQKELDELEFLELIVSFEEIAEMISTFPLSEE